MIGLELKTRRQMAAGVSQRDLGRLLGLIIQDDGEDPHAIPQSTISTWEMGTRGIPPVLEVPIREAFDAINDQADVFAARARAVMQAQATNRNGEVRIALYADDASFWSDYPTYHEWPAELFNAATVLAADELEEETGVIVVFEEANPTTKRIRRVIDEQGLTLLPDSDALVFDTTGDKRLDEWIGKNSPLIIEELKRQRGD